jgi:hypothetical protein
VLSIRPWHEDQRVAPTTSTGSRERRVEEQLGQDNIICAGIINDESSEA